VKCVYLRAIGEVADDDLSAIEAAIEQCIGFRPTRLDPLPDPAFAWDPRRGQYSSTAIMRQLLASGVPDGKLVGITERDIYIPMLTFVFGQAQLNGQLALVSLARLRQSFYGLPEDRAVFLERAAKEFAHELGHTFGLLHCSDRRCPMSLSADIRQVDAKGATYCAACTALLREGESYPPVSGACNEDTLGNPGSR
jgi:archaemetzincin